MGFQNSPEVAWEPYKYLLERFRGGCLEIDTGNPFKNGDDLQVWHALPGNANILSPMLALAGRQNPASLKKILETVRDYALQFKDETLKEKCYPIILSIDMKNKNTAAFQRFSKVCEAVFGSSKLLWKGDAYSLQLRDVMGKILIKNGSWVKTNKENMKLWVNEYIAFPKDEKMKSLEDGQDIPNDSNIIYKRVFPKSSEMKSGNFNPLPYWEKGVQMVALNMQTNDKFANMNTMVFYYKPFIFIDQKAKNQIIKIYNYIDKMFDPLTKSLLTTNKRCKDNELPVKILLKAELECKNIDGCELTCDNKRAPEEPTNTPD